jgi:2-methylcitrate dehydratase PrpD
VQVVIFAHALKIAGVHWPTKPAETPFCLRYVVATLLIQGRLGIADMENPDLQSPVLQALAERVHVSTDEAFQRSFPEKRPSRVTITLKDGRSLSAYRELRRGDPEDPFDWVQLQARMRAFAPAMTDAQAAELTRWCEVFTDATNDDTPCRPHAGLFAA